MLWWQNSARNYNILPELSCCFCSLPVYSCVPCLKDHWLFEDPISCVEQSLNLSAKKISISIF